MLHEHSSFGDTFDAWEIRWSSCFLDCSWASRVSHHASKGSEVSCISWADLYCSRYFGVSHGPAAGAAVAVADGLSGASFFASPLQETTSRNVKRTRSFIAGRLPRLALWRPCLGLARECEKNFGCRVLSRAGGAELSNATCVAAWSSRTKRCHPRASARLGDTDLV